MSNDPLRIAFLGYGTRALDALMADNRFDVRYFLAPEKRLCQDVYDAAERYRSRVSLDIVRDNAALYSKLSGIDDIECVLINACNIIINEANLALFPFFNIHPGSLSTNRGHHPHLWTVRLGETESEINLHQVTPGIDEGGVVARVRMDIPSDWNAFQVLDSLEDHIPELLDGLYRFLREDGQIIEYVSGGEYRRIMKPEDYRIEFDPSWDTEMLETDIDRKIRCRSMHHGAFFLYEGERIYVDSLEQKLLLPEKSPLVVSFEDSEHVSVMLNSTLYLFHINKRQPETDLPENGK